MPIDVSDASMKAQVVLASSLCCNASLLAQDTERQAEADIVKLLPIPSTEFIPPPPAKEVPAIRVEAATTRTLPPHQITALRGEVWGVDIQLMNSRIHHLFLRSAFICVICG